MIILSAGQEMAGDSKRATTNLLRNFLARGLLGILQLGPYRLRLIRAWGLAIAFVAIVFGTMTFGLKVSSAAAAGRAVVYGGRDRMSLPAIVARAKRGDSAAQVLLARLYSIGQGVPQNYYEAAKWFYRAADHGNGGAQYALGMLYNKGEGVRRDYVLSYMWLNLSAAQAAGDDRDFRIRMRDALASKMTPRQVQIAQDMAVKWSKSR